VNYLQYIHEAVSASTSTPVYAYAAPQGVAEDFIVIQLGGLDVSETKDEYKAERVGVTLFMHYTSADTAQAELSQIRHHLQNYPRVIPMYVDFVTSDSGDVEGEACVAETLGVAAETTFTLAYMKGLQMFYNEDDETVILAADFTFLINY
jgi:hypothetical protein